MTLSPVFKSPEAVAFLEDQGIFDRLQPALRTQAAAVDVLYQDVKNVIDARYLSPRADRRQNADADSDDGRAFIQDFFFLVLFASLFDSLGVSEQRLAFYAEVNFCIKGTITAADNLFDDQDKSLLPLANISGSRFSSILQLMCFERLLRRSCDRAVHASVASAAECEVLLRELITWMAEIGTLEGSEEGGVSEILSPESMIDRVHRIRGGALFSLAFVAPTSVEHGEVLERISAAQPAIARLGTSFQIVDDLTDFEFDVRRRSHNLLASQVFHHGDPEERSMLTSLWHGDDIPEGVVETVLRKSARAVLDSAYDEARAAFDAMAALGFWFPPDLAPSVVQAIVGVEGTERMQVLVSP